ncbi:hypothetical protein SKAU_G00258340 [Synaphobranchus kaupii]|uniref:Uncharacterized protein n=1 Tax=Synaphobranchus kaupii TaxID=118154 RepID=A0A9Q1IQH3_SYNKA|nr:hypothetical protein SKAU_G00258340 [Synaphobranchus kaupii]
MSAAVGMKTAMEQTEGRTRWPPTPPPSSPMPTSGGPASSARAQCGEVPQPVRYNIYSCFHSRPLTLVTVAKRCSWK